MLSHRLFAEMIGSRVRPRETWTGNCVQCASNEIVLRGSWLSGYPTACPITMSTKYR
jgi:hypothetical protein